MRPAWKGRVQRFPAPIYFMATTAAVLTPEYLFVRRDIARYDLIRSSVLATEVPKIRNDAPDRCRWGEKKRASECPECRSTPPGTYRRLRCRAGDFLLSEPDRDPLAPLPRGKLRMSADTAQRRQQSPPHSRQRILLRVRSIRSFCE